MAPIVIKITPTAIKSPSVFGKNSPMANVFKAVKQAILRK